MGFIMIMTVFLIVGYLGECWDRRKAYWDKRR